MKYQEGESGNPAGRPPGAVNKLTKTVRETVLATFNILQEDKKVNLVEWAKKHPKDFYLIAAKLIPMEIEHKGDLNREIIIRWEDPKNLPIPLPEPK